MRNVILHYHFFKNAGTSLDAAFKENFSEQNQQWKTKEFQGRPNKIREDTRQWIIENPQTKCFSSHTAILPPPSIDGIKIVPVIFFRHPIVRIASAYYFERKQGGDRFGATLARNTTLRGYIETRLSIIADRQCRNFHTYRLAAMFDESYGDEATRAEMAIQNLPFIGVVEKYEESLAELERLLKKEVHWNIKLKPLEINSSRNKKNSKNKLKDIEQKLDSTFYKKLLDINKSDISLYFKLLDNKNSSSF